MLRSLAREALRNLGPRHLAVGLISAGLLGASGTLVAAQAASALVQEQAIIDAGGTVWWVQSDASGDPVPVRICADLGRSGGVFSAGGVGESLDTWEVAGLGSPVSVDLGTVGLWSAWGRSDLDGQLVVGSDLAELGTVGVGTRLANGREEVVVTARTDALIQPSRLRANVTIPHVADFVMSECWVRMEPAAFESGYELVVSAFAGYPVKIQAFAERSAGVLTPAEQWNQFASMPLWVFAGLLCGATVSLLAWTRRTELAVYRAFGTTKAELLALISTESALILTPATAIAIGAQLWLAATNSGLLTLGAGDTQPLADAILVGARTTVAGALLGWLFGSLAGSMTSGGHIVQALKDR